MPHLLRIDASIDPAISRSRAVTQTFADAWTARGTEWTVTEIDLRQTPVPTLRDGQLHFAESLRRPGSEVDPVAEAAQKRLIDQLLGADVVLLGAPMYQYTVPSTIKAWLEQIHVVGVTVPFGDVEAPMSGRTAVVVSSRGGTYDEGSPSEGWDHEIPVLRLVLEQGLGMELEVIATSRTLSDHLAPLADQADRAAQELAAAHDAARALAARL